MISLTAQTGNFSRNLVRQWTRLSAQNSSVSSYFSGEDCTVSIIIIIVKPHKHLSDTNFIRGVQSTVEGSCQNYYLVTA